jgi:hypothetical protein
LKSDVDAESTNANGKDGSASLDLRPLFIAKIQQLVKDGSKGLYHIDIDSMDVDLLQSRVTLHKVQLLHDTNVLKRLDSIQQAPNDVFNAAFDSLHIEGINLNDVVKGNKIDLEEIYIYKPTIEIFHEKRRGARTVDSLTLYDRLMKNTERIAIASVVVHQGRFINHNKKEKKKTVFDNIVVSLENVLVDSSTEHATDRFLFAKQASISLNNYEMKSKDNAYITEIGSLKVTAPKNEMVITNISVRSRHSRKEFQKGLTHQKEQYSFSTPSVIIRNIDWWALMHDSLFVADELTLSGGALKIFLDRSLPRPESKMGNFPHQLIMKLPFEINIARGNIRNFDLKYEEYNPKSGDTGLVQFDDIDLNLSGITNLPAERKKRKQMLVTGSALFKNVPVKARFSFDLLKHKSGRFSASFSADDFDAKLVNGISQPLGLMKFEKGHINKLSVTMQGDEQRANGKVLMLYSDFKISIYEHEKNKDELDKRKLLGFIVNSFVLKDNNPSGNDPPRNPYVEFDRNPQTGFFNLVWKTTLTGILKIVGANPSLAEK